MKIKRGNVQTICQPVQANSLMIPIDLIWSRGWTTSAALTASAGTLGAACLIKAILFAVKARPAVVAR